MYAKGNMNGADKIPVSCNPGAQDCPPSNPQFKYVDNSTGLLNPYFQLAQQYTFGDRMFQTNQGPSLICSLRRIPMGSRMQTATLAVRLRQPNS
jgi:hypothetical protein